MRMIAIVLAISLSTFSAAAAVAPGDLLKESDGVEFRFAYFPSASRVRLLVLRPPAAMDRWQATVSSGGKAIAQREGGLPFPAQGEAIDVPPLADGTYQVRLALLGPNNARREFARNFQRKHFEWEGTPLGRDRVVIPPFTPLTVEGNPPTVCCVLRRHTLDGTGLWQQATSQGQALLAAPMRLEFELSGKRHVAQGGGVEISQRDPDRVRGAATWTAGPIAGKTEFDFDYDGVTRLAIELPACGEKLDALDLVIPMRTDETSLMHPVTDLLRFHYAGQIPNGSGKIWDYAGKQQMVRYTETGQPDADGKVWDSRHVGRYQLPGPFVPYIWLGGTERGIAWFAENDRDWSLAADRPALEIRRQGATTSLVVRIVSRPVVLSRPRRIVFGLMATPAKPMPEAPVSYRRWWTGPASDKADNVVALGFMGACYYWGGAGPCASFYPGFKNFSIYDEFARLRKGGAVDPGFTDRWLAQFSAPEFKPQLDTYRAHVNWSVRFFGGGSWTPKAGRTGYVIPYTNGRAINWADEAETFMDEWSTIDIADPRWPAEERFVRTGDGYRLAAYGKVETPGETSGIAYAIDPVPSWQDLVLFYHRRMLDTFADGIYFDDYFLSANYNPAGPGYVDDEGRLRPGVNLFGFHDLTKRVAVMQHTLGRRPMVFLHITNANIVPMLSFGTMILDHEWRDQGDYRGKDCQERFDLDDDASMMLAQSTGLQSGCLGVLHNLFYHDDRLVRTALGVALTHEMRMGVDGGGVNQAVGTLLCNFGYGLPDCRVWRYWDAAQPVKTTGAKAKLLVLARGGQAMIVVASYGPGGAVTLDLDKTLGLPDDAVATNAETGERLAQPAPGRIELALPRHDFRIVRIEK